MLLTLTSDSIEASVCCCPFPIPPTPPSSPSICSFAHASDKCQVKRVVRLYMETTSLAKGESLCESESESACEAVCYMAMGRGVFRGRGGCRERGPVKHCSGGTCRGCHYVKLDAVKCCALSFGFALPLLLFLSATHSPPPSFFSACLSPSCSAFNAYKLR